MRSLPGTGDRDREVGGRESVSAGGILSSAGAELKREDRRFDMFACRDTTRHSGIVDKERQERWNEESVTMKQD